MHKLEKHGGFVFVDLLTSLDIIFTRRTFVANLSSADVENERKHVAEHAI
jgi:hypothetical protein